MSEEREAQEPMRGEHDDPVRDGGDPRLHEYLDGRLPPEERARLERALAADPLLRERLRELREIDALVAALPGHAAPPDFTARVARAARGRRLGGILRLAVPLAAAAAILVAVLTHAHHRPARKALLRPEAEAPAPAEDRYIWESDEETYGSLALTDLEELILEELDGT